MNKTERKVMAKIALSLFAEHLYDGLLRKKNYGLVEATRHWNAAKNSPLEYAFIEFDGTMTVGNISSYLNDHDENVSRIEEYLKDMGTLNLSYEELDRLELLRAEKARF